jgi:hypothetical protein
MCRRVARERERPVTAGERTVAARHGQCRARDVSPETFGAFREAMKLLRQKGGEPLDDDAALLLMAPEILGDQPIRAEAATKSL